MATEDAVSRTSHAMQYSYHHGFYDGVEREFRGFARVDTLDADALPAQSGDRRLHRIPPTSEGEFLLPPVRTRSWYHTGAFFDREDIAARLAARVLRGRCAGAEARRHVLPHGC